MEEDDLKSYLEGERAEGEFAGSGSFGIDFQSELAKRARFSLPRPGMWAVRAIQGLVRIGANSVLIKQTRDRFIICAPLSSQVSARHALADIFCTHRNDDPLVPLQAALLAGLGRDFHLEMHWSEAGRRKAMLLGPAQSSIIYHPEPMPVPAIEIHAQPAKRSLLAKLFSVADFSSEFQEVNRGTFLAPLPVAIDNRPCDFRTGFRTHFYPAVEFRGVRATSGPRLPLRPGMAEALARPSLEGNKFYEPLGDGGYAFLLSLGWSNTKNKMSTVGWITDGVLVDEEPLFTEPSPLHLTLFLPAGDLPTDATGMALRQTPERARRVAEARLWATTSLKTHFPPPPPVPDGESKESMARRLEAEVEARMNQALEASAYTKTEAQRMRDAIETHLRKQRPKPRETNGPRETSMVSGYLSEQERRERESLERWGAFLSYTPLAEEKRYSPVQNVARQAEVRFFGDVYVEFPEKRRQSAQT